MRKSTGPLTSSPPTPTTTTTFLLTLVSARASAQSPSFNFQASPVFPCSSSIIHLIPAAGQPPLLLPLLSPYNQPYCFFVFFNIVIIKRVSHHVHQHFFFTFLSTQYVSLLNLLLFIVFPFVGHYSSSSLTSCFSLTPLALCMNNGGDTRHFPLPTLFARRVTFHCLSFSRCSSNCNATQLVNSVQMQSWPIWQNVSKSH